MADTFAAARLHTADARDRYLLARLEATTAQLARLALSAQDPARADTRQADLQRMEAEKERLEAELSARRADLRAGLHAVTLDAVQAAIPLDAALVEFALFRPFDPRAERNAEAYGAPRYAAYALRTQVAPRGVDLGPAAPIDAAVAALRSALRDPQRADVKARARALDELIMRPLRGSFGDATRLLLSPDGELSLVPFEALVDEQGRYLIERYATSYVTSGRDLLRMQVPRASRSHAVVFADPLFGEPGPAHAESAARKQIATNLRHRSVTTGTDLSSVYFAPLAATGDEARAIKRLFPEASLFMGGRATKAALQRLQAPRMLHIASHGFFLQPAPSARGGV